MNESNVYSLKTIEKKEEEAITNILFLVVFMPNENEMLFVDDILHLDEESYLEIAAREIRI